ncbi:3D (Asp-Asp-Asp) domain-containing protein [Sporosarcina psychrophila]|uniref:3D (Asp-Asp-Asp) domain-containing protein n=1 Tax=Sporosarcina psychrophila TaxID=1476 RepID=A0ABV2KBN9_SPOPS
MRVTLADGSSFEAIAEDVGGAIRGSIIDVAHETKADANRFGRQSVEVRMIRKGR